MHAGALVIGEDPMDVINARIEANNGIGIDWGAIGGRYTGSLILRPGATSGRVYGDAIPDFEAALVRALSDRDWTTTVRPGRRRGGVDQARKGDIDFPRTFAAGGRTPLVVVDGVWHEQDWAGPVAFLHLYEDLMERLGAGRVPAAV